MRRLIFITQQADPGHPVLAATVPKLAALARRVEELVVLADGAVPEALPANCRVRTFRAATKAGRGLRFELALARELARRPDAVIAHMCPIYAVLAAPLARPLGVPVVLWYTHWKATPTLRAAERLSTAVASVDTRSFPLPTPKARAIGHGIDVAEFECSRDGSRGPGFRALVLGRYSPAKGLETVVRAVRVALDRGLDLRLEAHGPALSAEERAHRRDLERLVDELDLAKRVRLDHAVLRAELPGLFARADVLVNNMRAGAPDKVVYEAGASCVPVLASNPVFDELVDDLTPRLRFEREDPEDLATALEGLAEAGEERRRELGQALRARVAERHGVDAWAAKIIEVARV